MDGININAIINIVDGVGEHRYMPIVSIIVPVYNVEKYLERSIGSLIDQSYRNIEIILIDDGSTDTSSIICDKYACKDRRIKVKHIQNAGVSNARNIALDMATGDYISFVDADDWLDNHFIEESLDDMQKYKTDILLGNFYFEYENGVSKQGLENLQTCHMNNIEALQMMFVMLKQKKNIPWTVWGKLYHKRVIGECRFYDDFSMGEDAIWLWNVLKNAKNVIYSPFCGYHYLQRDSSVMHKQKASHILDDKKMYEYFFFDRYWLNNQALISYFEDRYFAAKVTTVIRLFKKNDEAARKEFRDFKDNYSRCLLAEWRLHSLKGMLKMLIASGCGILS